MPLQLIPPVRLQSFNPYFSGCFSLRCEYQTCPHGGSRMFQSLFFWMLLSKLCARTHEVRIAMFQSLFFWMLLSKLHLPEDVVPTVLVCFNPYFSGCFSLRHEQQQRQPYQHQCFNPYFSGCFSLSRMSACIPFCKIHEFQSLFFWMLLSKCLDPRCIIPVIASFNPYFSGCFSLSTAFRRAMGKHT